MRSKLFQSYNPVFRRALDQEQETGYGVATYGGVAIKTLIYLLLVVAGGFGGIFLLANNPQIGVTVLVLSLLTSGIFSFIAILFPKTSKVLGSLYCLMQGFVVGLISISFEGLVPGVILVTVLATIAVLLVVATLYLSGIVRVNNTFLNFLFIFVVSVLISQVLIYLGSLFSSSIALLFNNYLATLVISLVMIFLVTLYLFFDLENIRRVVEGKAPKYLEWYVSFGLVFTIIWLYFQLLPLVVRILANRD